MWPKVRNYRTRDGIHSVAFITIIGLLIGAAIALVSYGLWYAFADHGQYLSNDQIILETKKCNAAGLEADRIENGFNYKVMSVVCGGPKK